MMGPIFLGHKVQIGCGGWVEHCLDRCRARIADGADGQASPGVSVIGSVLLKVGSGEVAIKVSESVNYRWVTLKPNPFSEAI